VPFRCDSPELRRDMTMEIVPLEGGLLEFRCHLDKAEPRAAVPTTFEETDPSRPALILSCSWCKRIKTADGWLEIEAFVAERRVFLTDEPLRVTHGICEPCLERQLRLLEVEPSGS
jgi:hypothetical protein